MKADFKSVRGPFRFNTNHFPIESFYLYETVKEPFMNDLCGSQMNL